MWFRINIEVFHSDNTSETETRARQAGSERAGGRKMTCTHRLWGEPTGLCCNREPDHVGGHTYADSLGSFVPDKADRRRSHSYDLLSA